MSFSSDEEYEVMDLELHVLRDKYILLKELGCGSYASVWLSYNVYDEKYYAIKVSRKKMSNIASNEGKIYDRLKRYKCESLMDAVEHFDCQIDNEKCHCIVMELLGMSTYDYLKHLPFSPEIVFKFIEQVLKGLCTLHSNNIIHGDIKPENILMNVKNKKISDYIKKLGIKNVISLLNAKMRNKQRQIRKKQLLPQGEEREKLLDEIEKILYQIDPCDEEEKEEKNEKNAYDFSDDDTDSDALSLSSHGDSDSDIDSDLEVDVDVTPETVNFKIVDLGGCILENQKKRKKVQTCYYMPPEVILRLDYNEKSDMWAFGCTVYELLTGKTLFDPSKYQGNENRYHLHLITENLGVIPDDMIEKSPYKDILFTSRRIHKIKGFKKINKSNFMSDIETLFSENKTDERISNKIINLIRMCLEIDPEKRIDSEKALQFILSN
jgi:serine/threonine protein kinase